MAALFSDHMVLQRDTSIPVWGWAAPGEAVTVSIAGQKQSATADAKGKWSVKLDQLTAKDKQTVGKRLALWARAKVYGENIAFSGPLYASNLTKNSGLVISYTQTDGGLVAKNGDLKGFVIAGADRRWVVASASIEGDKVIVSNPAVHSPAAVRYAWADNPDCNLSNGAGLPAAPFRTDNW